VTQPKLRLDGLDEREREIVREMYEDFLDRQAEEHEMMEDRDS